MTRIIMNKLPRVERDGSTPDRQLRDAGKDVEGGLNPKLEARAAPTLNPA